MQFNNKVLKKLKWKEVQRKFFLMGLEPPCWATFRRWIDGGSEPSLRQVAVFKEMLKVDYDFFIKK